MESLWKEKGQKRAPRRDAGTALLLSEIFFIDIKKAAGCHLVIMDQGNGFPQGFIQVFSQGIHEAVVFLPEYLIFALFHYFKLVPVRFFPVKGADAFDDFISSGGFHNAADLIISQIKGGVGEGLLLFAFAEGQCSLGIIAVFLNQRFKRSPS